MDPYFPIESSDFPLTRVSTFSSSPGLQSLLTEVRLQLVDMNLGHLDQTGIGQLRADKRRSDIKSLMQVIG